jgi:hypothetical protein
VWFVCAYLLLVAAVFSTTCMRGALTLAAEQKPSSWHEDACAASAAAGAAAAGPAFRAVPKVSVDLFRSISDCGCRMAAMCLYAYRYEAYLLQPAAISASKCRRGVPVLAHIYT